MAQLARAAASGGGGTDVPSPSAPSASHPVAAVLVAGLVVSASVWLREESALQLSVLFGGLFGFCIQRSRFCFQCIWRDWLVERDHRGMLAVLLALAVGIVGYTLVFGAWLPAPAAPRLPPTAHIGPVGPALLLAGVAFGVGMAVSGSCISAHLYRLGEGSPTAPFALVGTAAGFGFGFLTWNPLYLQVVSESPVIWLPHHFGYSGALIGTLAVLAGTAFGLQRHGRPPLLDAGGHATSSFHLIFIARWPAWIGGLCVGLIGIASYFRVGPLGVTAEIGSRTRQAVSALELLPGRLEGLDAFRGCATLVRDVALTPNGLFVASLILGSLAGALVDGRFRLARPARGQILRGLSGGVLMGWGAMTGLGCTVGTLLSGISAGALSGWLFGAACLAASAAVVAFQHRRGRAI